jgi:hypothetical protein
MKYRITKWSWNAKAKQKDIDAFNDSQRHRNYKENSWISILEENEWKHLEAEDDNHIFLNYIDAEIKFNEILKSKGLKTWKELLEIKEQNEINLAKIEINNFIQNGKELLFELKNKAYIYFLIHNDNIVYVGQTYSLATKRPYAHTDKIYDKIMVYPLIDDSQLNALESYLIYKLNPKYNQHPGQYGQDKLKTVIFSLNSDKLKKD